MTRDCAPWLSVGPRARLATRLVEWAGVAISGKAAGEPERFMAKDASGGRAEAGFRELAARGPR